MSDLTVNETLFLLRDSRRRYVLDALQSETSIELSELADRVAALEHGDDYSDEQRKATYVSLKQTHVPNLDEHDVVEYRGLANIVVPGDEFGVASNILTTVRETLDTDFKKRLNTAEAPPER